MSSNIHALIASADRGDRSAADALFRRSTPSSIVSRAGSWRAGGARGLGATTLLHEAYLAIPMPDAAFPDRARFMAYAARVMRGLIIDEIRGRFAGSGAEVSSTRPWPPTSCRRSAMPRCSSASATPWTSSPRTTGPGRVVDLKFFCGFSVDEIAAMRGVSDRTAKRAWEKSRIYLDRALGGTAGVI